MSSDSFQQGSNDIDNNETLQRFLEIAKAKERTMLHQHQVCPHCARFCPTCGRPYNYGPTWTSTGFHPGSGLPVSY